MPGTATKLRPIPEAVIRRAQTYRVAVELARRDPRGAAAWYAAVDAAQLRALAKRLDTYNVIRCNRDVTPREEKGAENARARVVRIAGEYGATAHFGGDPRGPAVRLYWPDMIPDGKDAEAYTDRMIVVEV